MGPSRQLGSRPGECSVLEAAYIIIIRGDKGRGLGLAWGSNGGVELLPLGQPGGSCELQPEEGLQHRRTELHKQKNKEAGAAAVLWAEEEEHEGEEARPSP